MYEVKADRQSRLSSRAAHTGLATASVRLLLFRARRKIAKVLREQVSRGLKRQ